jgi:hypothetical protein
MSSLDPHFYHNTRFSLDHPNLGMDHTAKGEKCPGGQLIPAQLNFSGPATRGKMKLVSGRLSLQGEISKHARYTVSLRQLSSQRTGPENHSSTVMTGRT